MPYTTTFSARIDSGSANNPALNLTGDAAQSITFVNSTSGGGAGDLILEANGGSPDPDTVVEIDGTQYSFTLDYTGTLPTLKKDGAQQVPDALEGEPIYVVIVHDYPTPGTDTRFAFIPDESISLAEMDSFGNGAIDIQNVDYTPPPTPVCFGEGTLISTIRGDVPVEELETGDNVITHGGDVRPILWVSHTRHVWSEEPHRHKPIKISAQALGNGLPKRDLIVSPQHKILLPSSESNGAYLAPAVGLIGQPGIRQMRGKRIMRYYHILLDAHDVLVADGVPAESFYPGETAIAMLGLPQRLQLCKALSVNGLTPETYGPVAAPCLSRADTRRRVTTRLRTAA